MKTAWSDEVYTFEGDVQGTRRWWWPLACYFHCHVMGVPQCRDPKDLTRSQGPCRRCGGHHYWRNGRWVMGMR